MLRPSLPVRILRVIGSVARTLRDDIDFSIVLTRDGTKLAFARQNSEGNSEFIIADSGGAEERHLLSQRILFVKGILSVPSAVWPAAQTKL